VDESWPPSFGRRAGRPGLRRWWVDAPPRTRWPCANGRPPPPRPRPPAATADSRTFRTRGVSSG